VKEVDLDALNQARGGFNENIGLTFVAASEDEVVAELTVKPELQQPYGIVHGGVHCAVIETVCSTGAAIAAMKNNQSVVGLENSTSFIRAVREGKLTCRATPVTRGRKSQVWAGTVTDESGRTVATGRVRLLCLDSGSMLAGETVGLGGG
jgi:1,4-dihydroxy-2-naphthoyl-CoA hydrolase